MAQQEWLADRFEAHRAHLRAVAYRMLGSVDEADHAVQEAWLGLSRSDTGGVDDLRAWLTSVVARRCLTLLRARKTRRTGFVEPHARDPIVNGGDRRHAEQELLIGDSAGLALQVVLDSLSADEGLAFVLHDVFAMSFDAMAPIVGGTPTAARQLASRARRRVQGAPVPDGNLPAQWVVVDAFFAAARSGDVEGLRAVLDSSVVLRSDAASRRDGLVSLVRGAEPVAERAATLDRFSEAPRLLVNGIPGRVALAPDGTPFLVVAVTVRSGRIVEIDVLGRPARLRQLDLSLVCR